MTELKDLAAILLIVSIHVFILFCSITLIMAAIERDSLGMLLVGIAGCVATFIRACQGVNWIIEELR